MNGPVCRYACLMPSLESGFDMDGPRIERGCILIPIEMRDEDMTGYCVEILAKLFPIEPMETWLCIRKPMPVKA